MDRESLQQSNLPRRSHTGCGATARRGIEAGAKRGNEMKVSATTLVWGLGDLLCTQAAHAQPAS